LCKQLVFYDFEPLPGHNGECRIGESFIEGQALL
jgi:hypothetical protein